MKNQLPQEWFPKRPPIYDIKKTYLENLIYGPFFSGKIPERTLQPKSEWFDFLGHRVASPLGVPAGPLLSSNWIRLAADLGFDVLTYKTIRSKQHPSHPLPNMVHVDTKGMLHPHNNPFSAKVVGKPSAKIDDLAVTNSFGMPSMSQAFLMEDIAEANDSLEEGQVMIVSVVGTSRSDETFLNDFVQAAVLAKNAGAKIIEANFSCPNVDKKDGCLYMSPTTVYDIASAITKAIHPIPLVIKMGIFSNLDHMRDVMKAAAKAGVRAVSGINTISMNVVDEAGRPALGENRLTSGICGGPIRNAAVHFIQEAKKINDEENLALTIMGVGGIVHPTHFTDFLEAGADIAMCATGMMWDPYLAAKYHQLDLEK